MTARVIAFPFGCDVADILTRLITGLEEVASSARAMEGRQIFARMAGVVDEFFVKRFYTIGSFVGRRPVGEGWGGSTPDVGECTLTGVPEALGRHIVQRAVSGAPHGRNTVQPAAPPGPDTAR